MKNTRIVYSYRDGDNYKVAGDVVLAGLLSQSDKDAILAHCDSALTGNPSFIPGQVGLKDLQDSFETPSRWDDRRDHPWHEIDVIEDTDMAADSGDAQDFTRSFLATAWDHAWLPEFHDSMRARTEDPVPGF